MLRYDASRTTDREAIEAQVPQGYGIVDSVLEHRQEDDGFSFFPSWTFPKIGFAFRIVAR